MENLKETLIKEKKELEEKLNKLNTLLLESNSKKLDKTQYLYIKAQSKVMEDYIDILIYRIMNLEGKEEKEKYRCFKSKEECWNEMQKHKPFGWVYYEDAEEALHISAITNSSIRFGVYVPFEHALEKCTFVDGTPFGIKNNI